jgi:hypothetical protein
MYEELDLTGYCGLYCPDCIRYKSKATDLAKALLDELKVTGFKRYAGLKSSSVKQLNRVKQFEHYKECCDVLQAIVTLQCNRPCRTGGGCPTFSCRILECCKSKGFEGCWQCGKSANCEQLKPLEPIHGVCVKENLRSIRESGLEQWIKNRCEPYIWQQ